MVLAIAVLLAVRRWLAQSILVACQAPIALQVETLGPSVRSAAVRALGCRPVLASAPMAPTIRFRRTPIAQPRSLVIAACPTETSVRRAAILVGVEMVVHVGLRPRTIRRAGCAVTPAMQNPVHPTEPASRCPGLRHRACAWSAALRADSAVLVSRVRRSPRNTAEARLPMPAGSRVVPPAKVSATSANATANASPTTVDSTPREPDAAPLRATP